jgi:hypothetical protein
MKGSAKYFCFHDYICKTQKINNNTVKGEILYRRTQDNRWKHTMQHVDITCPSSTVIFFNDRILFDVLFY